MTVLSRSKNAAVRTRRPGGDTATGPIAPASAGLVGSTGLSIKAPARHDSAECTNWQFTTGAGDCNLSWNRCFPPQAVLAPLQGAVWIVSITRLMPGVHQPDPPGLIHDDLRLLPPWRGSSLLVGTLRPADK